MSVVNDVLKNLERRHAQEKIQRAIPHVHSQKVAPPYLLWFLLISILAVGVVMAFSILEKNSVNSFAIGLPADIFLIASHPQQKLPASTVAVTEHAKPLVKSLAHSSPRLVTKTAQTRAIEKAVSAIESGDASQARSVMNLTPQVIRDEIQLRLMIKEMPEQVLPHIRKNFKNFEQQADLLAMAAQAEQRAGSHTSAIDLYKQLIVLQPRDARWRAGIAISLEASGRKQVAKKMYQQAINMPNLPPALQNFSEQRLALLR